MPPPHSAKDFEAMAKARAKALREHIFALPTEQLQGKPLAVAQEIEKFADSQRLPMIFREEKMRIARQVLRNQDPKPKVLVEFGTFVGCSAIGWGQLLRESNEETAGAHVHVYGFELDPELAQVARDLIKLAGLDDVVTVIDGPGAESLRKLVAEGAVKVGGVDAVFIDHWEKLYVPDLQVCEELQVFHKGSVIMADNTDFPGAPDYLQYVKGGGSGQPGAVRYESKSFETDSNVSGRPKVVEVTSVIHV
ncbi:S-adenosyl-L-methionine-dependent methyltransferase [Truncatella angustata]|uniref:catechol O-methyltransferase n=1 Tax=Truncatella angustata TaxID=152316 RepID=A0A9P8ZYH5_9PEZI|nr:S-adenosyl-L-methionine-dependent methyltransferase [Truncatella angustata]KAH6655028.1 S-adenosyl-L-methionine-dependent methyltransferase [Truncatella angustata]KAH8196101.1 hypothetical protein TruAng_009728 [Truncatella angustata]